MPSRYPGAIKQEWEPVVLHKSKPKSQDLRDPKAVNQALRSGAAVQTIKKSDGGTNKKSAAASTVVSAKKLDSAEEPDALHKVSTEVRHAIQKARLEKKMSQAELANSSTSVHRLCRSTRTERRCRTRRFLPRWSEFLALSSEELRSTNKPSKYV